MTYLRATRVLVALLFIATGSGVSFPQTPPPGSWSGRKADGAYLFNTFCASCHGRQGVGDGPMAESMRVRPSNLTMLAQKNGGQFPSDLVFRTIDGRQRVRGHGGPDMPVWGDIFSRTTVGWDPESVKQRIQQLVEYVESLQIRSG